ncbi:solute carrier family 39 (zinc transporter), member 1/2/3 [Paragonimus westermani]|uniref:Solute carrier family 39 (Zinc transporter), member 1/2/3 n=1 Tax=Paragonimus westermani TaxID=34504 RepID=A0A5J4NVY6_9TREM|nr:solute carrier family 39 (zinc transporter), member 1/2/3 [Paragonimus westermani]
MASLFFIKVICCFVVLLANGMAAFATFVFVHKRCSTQDFSPRLRQGLSQANCFSIGLFLSICFLGLYNSSSMKMRTVQSALEGNNPLKTYPLSEAMLCWGLFIFWLFEWTVRFLISHISSNNLRKQVFYVKSWKRSQPNRFAMDPTHCDDSDEQVDLLSRSPDNFTDHPTDSVVDQSSAENLHPKTVKTIHLPANSFLKSVVLASAMSIHSFLEALGFGLLDSINQISFSVLYLLCDSAASRCLMLISIVLLIPEAVLIHFFVCCTPQK